MRIPTTLFALALLASPALADCKAELASVFETVKTQKSYRVAMSTTSGGATTKSDVNVILPDKFHVKSTGMEMIMMKKEAWMNVGAGWQVMPAPMAAMTSNMIRTGMQQGINAASNIKCLGQKEYQGSSYKTYSFDSKGKVMGIASTAKVTMYTKANMPVWMVVDGKAMGTASKTVQKFTPDSTIKIVKPQ